MAIERGQLQDLIFDNRALCSHRAMAAILGVILRLPPAKQALASRQLRSRYLERVLSEGGAAAHPLETPRALRRSEPRALARRNEAASATRALRNPPPRAARCCHRTPISTAAPS